MYLYQILILIKGSIVVGALVKDLIRKRTSVRTFNWKPILAEDKQRLEKFPKASDGAFGIPIEFRFLNAKKQMLR